MKEMLSGGGGAFIGGEERGLLAPGTYPAVLTSGSGHTGNKAFRAEEGLSVRREAVQCRIVLCRGAATCPLLPHGNWVTPERETAPVLCLHPFVHGL